MSYPTTRNCEGKTMSDSEEVIALVLGDSDEQDEWPDNDDTVGAKRLVRHDDGTVTLEPIASREELYTTGVSTGKEPPIRASTRACCAAFSPGSDSSNLVRASRYANRAVTRAVHDDFVTRIAQQGLNLIWTLEKCTTKNEGRKI